MSCMCNSFEMVSLRAVYSEGAIRGTLPATGEWSARVFADRYWPDATPTPTTRAMLRKACRGEVATGRRAAFDAANWRAYLSGVRP